MLESVLEGYAEYFSADLAEKVNRGMMENALKGMNNGAGIPLGYYVNDTQHLQIDEKKSAVRQRNISAFCRRRNDKDDYYRTQCARSDNFL